MTLAQFAVHATSDFLDILIRVASAKGYRPLLGAALVVF